MRPRVVSLAAGLVLAGCGLLPMQVECGDVDRATCQRLANGILASKPTERPGHRVVSLRIVDARGSYDLTWDDGAGESLIVD